MNKAEKAVLDLIKGEDSFLITSHINPDGDSVASQLALRSLLSSLGKTSVIVNCHAVPRIYRFLAGSGEILVRKRHSLRPYRALFVLDCGNRARAGVNLGGKSLPVVVNIDHHCTNNGYGDLNWIDSKASSTCEIIYDLAVKTGAAISPSMAEQIYTGILTDTGSFRYSSTTPRSMAIASRLLRRGVDPHLVAEEVYENAEYPSLLLLGRMLSRMGRTPDGLVSWVTFSHADLSSLSNPSETEEFVNYARSLNTALLAIGFKEVRPGEIRISFRSKGDVDVSLLASRYGGGGHRNASGCTVEGGLKKVERQVVSAARSFLAATRTGSGTPAAQSKRRCLGCT